MRPPAPASPRLPDSSTFDARRLPRRRHGILLACLCALGCGAAVAGATVKDNHGAILAAVSRADLTVRRGFAALALQTLVAVYRDELSRAAREAGSGWRAGAAGFVAGLERALTRVETAREIELAQEAHGAVRIGIDGEQFMLSVPRPERQRDFDCDLFSRFCRAWRCPEPPASDNPAGAPRATRLRTEWLFSDRGPPVLSAPDGLACVFDDTRHLRLKRLACERIMEELRRVADVLRAVTEAGHGLDWPALSLVPDPANGLLRLVHDAQGNYHHVDLPGLALVPDLLRDATPWLQARLRGHVGYSMIRLPERIAYQ